VEELLPVEAVRQQSIFVGRDKELAAYHNWLADKQAVSTLFVISGMSGIGKSALLAKMKQDTRDSGIHTIFLDGSACPASPSGFLEYLHTVLNTSKYRASIDVFFHNPSEERMVLFLDHFDELPSLHNWFNNAFLSQLAAKGVGIVVATRKRQGMNATAYIPTLSLPLTHLTYEETIHYLRKTTKLLPRQVQQLAIKLDGFPLGMVLAVDLLKSHNTPDIGVVSQTISANLLKEVTAVSLQPLLEVLIVMEFANQEMLGAVLEREVRTDEYRALQDLSFIALHPYGLKLHDVAKQYLLQDFQLREPARLSSMHRICTQVLYKTLTHACPTDREIITAALLRMNRDMWPKQNSYLSFTANLNQVYLGSIMEDDIDILHELLEHWCSYSVDTEHYQNYHDFLNAVIQLDPNSILIQRDSTQQAIGFSITMLYSTKTAPLLLCHFQADIVACFTTDGCRQAALQANTYIPIIVAATEYHPTYTREELVGMLIVEQLAKLEPGKRAAVVVSNSDLKQFLQTIGFTSRPIENTSCDTSWAKAEVLELDLRSYSFDDWILDLVPSIPRKSRTLTTADTRKLLQSIHSVKALEAYTDFLKGCKDGQAVQESVMQLLQRTDLLSPEQQAVLWNGFVCFPNNTVKATNACNMSRATFYRHQKKAIQKLTDILSM
jgi:hypothetical protein